ncbi:hypothetical protein ELQ35_06650 [Peribacillus cavernae]|uniref:Uncharacterized protein n=1 Tax=Peribacillus cavernae TaxID=1674310 RepID=A0A433HNY2_9BACI|nr:hypothetical protein [Peribacillus cavernae]MDQ0217535.1 hypothetical protein [Peribacillus cavernae]RUQ30029.1 hypothetical protein ELQ35_06650 [Peribacillus cavernae]
MGIFKGNKQTESEDHFTQFMFGRKAAPPPKEEKTDWKSIAANVDYQQLMGNFDKLMNAYNQVKPGLSKINPMLSKLIKKNKS